MKAKKKNVSPSSKKNTLALRKGEVLVLRCCKADMSSYGGFIWPKTGAVKAPDWKSTATCGKGLHGWLRGEGDMGCWSHSDTDLWLIVAVPENTIIDLTGKVKFPAGRVLYVGEKQAAAALVKAV